MCSVSSVLGNTGVKKSGQNCSQVEGGVDQEGCHFSSLGPRTRGLKVKNLNLNGRPEDFSSMR